MAMSTGSKILHGSVLLVGVLSVVVFFIAVPSGDGGGGGPTYRPANELRPVADPTKGVSKYSSGPKASGGGGGRGGGGGGGGGGDPCNIGEVVRQNGGFSMFKGFSANNTARDAACEMARQQKRDAIDDITERRGR